MRACVPACRTRPTRKRGCGESKLGVCPELRLDNPRLRRPYMHLPDDVDRAGRRRRPPAACRPRLSLRCSALPGRDEDRLAEARPCRAARPATPRQSSSLRLAGGRPGSRERAVTAHRERRLAGRAPVILPSLMLLDLADGRAGSPASSAERPVRVADLVPDRDRRPGRRGRYSRLIRRRSDRDENLRRRPPARLAPRPTTTPGSEPPRAR